MRDNDDIGFFGGCAPAVHPNTNDRTAPVAVDEWGNFAPSEDYSDEKSAAEIAAENAAMALIDAAYAAKKNAKFYAAVAMLGKMAADAAKHGATVSRRDMERALSREMHLRPHSWEISTGIVRTEQQFWAAVADAQRAAMRAARAAAPVLPVVEAPRTTVKVVQRPTRRIVAQV